MFSFFIDFGEAWWPFLVAWCSLPPFSAICGDIKSIYISVGGKKPNNGFICLSKFYSSNNLETQTLAYAFKNMEAKMMQKRGTTAFVPNCKSCCVTQKYYISQ